MVLYKRHSEYLKFEKDKIIIRPHDITVPQELIAQVLLALIGVGLIIVLISGISVDYNKHIGSPASPPFVHGEETINDMIWLSISKSNETIYITTRERDLFEWDISEQNKQADFEKYLIEQKSKIAINSSLKWQTLNKTTIVFSADQRLPYESLKPIIHTIAKLGFSNYAFETQKPFM